MLTKTLLVSSALAGASAAKKVASVPNAAAVASEGHSVSSTKSVRAAAAVGTSAVVTTGGYARELIYDCNSKSGDPYVYGYNLGECEQTGESSSMMYTSCEFNSASTSIDVITTSYATGSCSGVGTPSTSTKSGLVSGCGGSVSLQYQYYCGADVTFSSFGSPQHYGWWDNGSCSGNEYKWWIISYSACTDDSGCTSSGTSSSGKGVCDDPDDTCFHVDTKIDYKGVEYTYEELKAGKEPECTVPHSPASKGVVITTSCDKTVRVTDTHLMATTKGFQLAYSLKAGDVLFGDYSKDMCTVKAVEKEKTTQQYFGLNCVHSEVLASGLRASTFGDFHTLPSWYMTYVGGLVGSETASSLGEYIGEWYFQK